MQDTEFFMWFPSMYLSMLTPITLHPAAYSKSALGPRYFTGQVEPRLESNQASLAQHC